MQTQHGPDDDELLAELRAALNANPVTEQMRAEAVAAYTWRTIDAELCLASLVFDSDVEPAPSVPSTSPARLREIVFSHEDVAVTLELSSDQMLGQLAPALSCDVLVQGLDGAEHALTSDDLGLFRVRPGPSRPFRERARIGEVDLVTPWVTP